MNYSHFLTFLFPHLSHCHWCYESWPSFLLRLTTILTCPPRDSNPRPLDYGAMMITSTPPSTVKSTTPGIAAQCYPRWTQHAWWQVTITPAQRPGFESRRELFDFLVMILPVSWPHNPEFGVRVLWGTCQDQGQMEPIGSALIHNIKEVYTNDFKRCKNRKVAKSK